eukprot:8564458-Pyramimonas_sp.AAC.1
MAPTPGAHLQRAHIVATCTSGHLVYPFLRRQPTILHLADVETSHGSSVVDPKGPSPLGITRHGHCKH